MLALGLMAIASIGLAGILSGGGASDDDQEDILTEIQPEAETEEEVVEVVSEQAEQITQDVQTPVASGQDSVEDEDAVEEVVTEETADPETTTEVAFSVPPVIAPEPPLELSEMVVVSTIDEEEIADELVLTEGPETGEDQDRSYIIEPPEQLHAIELGYDVDTTFAVTPNDQTAVISSWLNTNIAGGDSVVVTSVEEIENSSGGIFTETTITKEYANDVHIVLNVDQSHVGVHVAQIDLSNPEDSLRFEFDHIQGFMHIVTYEHETADGDVLTSDSSRTAYVIETPLEIRDLDPLEIGRLISGNEAQNEDTHLVAEIYLGTSSLVLEGGDSVTSATAQTITDFTNEAPKITSNFYWASELEYTGGAVDTTTQSA
ncbi:MAG: hypothetical protein ABJJ53_01965 [Sulfitobacter sp.]